MDEVVDVICDAIFSDIATADEPDFDEFIEQLENLQKK